MAGAGLPPGVVGDDLVSLVDEVLARALRGARIERFGSGRRMSAPKVRRAIASQIAAWLVDDERVTGLVEQARRRLGLLEERPVLRLIVGGGAESSGSGG